MKKKKTIQSTLINFLKCENEFRMFEAKTITLLKNEFAKTLVFFSN